MGVFSRLSDIVNSNLNAMLDRAEDPEKIVRLIIQEMEDTLVEVRAQAARGIADKKEIERKRADFDARGREWETKAELAIAKGREDLARGAISAKRQALEMSEMLGRELVAIDRTLEKTSDDLGKLQAKLKEAKAKQRSMEVRRTAASGAVRVGRHLADDRIEDAVSRYERWERRIDELEAEAESYGIGRPKSLDEAFRDLAAEDEVSAEFEALKARVAARVSGH